MSIRSSKIFIGAMNDQRITARETQRVIKYRAWDGEQMLFPEAGDIIIHIDDGGLVVYQLIENDPDDEDAISDYSTKQINAEVMQFTGLLDKHGKEIYEHDLYRRYSYVYRVEWDKDSAGFAGIVVGRYDNNGENYSPCTSDRLFNISEDEETELVGNIYTTPELVDPKMIER